MVLSSFDNKTVCTRKYQSLPQYKQNAAFINKLEEFFLCDLDSLCVAETAFAGKWRLRPRKHLDTVTLKYGNQIEKETTSGIGPTINFWWEEAYENSFGLALGLMYIDFGRESESIGRGQRMELWKLGFEGKHDPLQGDGGLFSRWGISINLLKTQGSLGELKGNGG